MRCDRNSQTRSMLEDYTNLYQMESKRCREQVYTIDLPQTKHGKLQSPNSRDVRKKQIGQSRSTKQIESTSRSSQMPWRQKGKSVYLETIQASKYKAPNHCKEENGNLDLHEIHMIGTIKKLGCAKPITSPDLDSTGKRLFAMRVERNFSLTNTLQCCYLEDQFDSKFTYCQ